MALIFKGSKCSICNNEIDRSKPYFSITAFLSKDHPLWRQSDSAMHWDCYLPWECREQFVQDFAKVVEFETLQNPFWTILYTSPTLSVQYGKSVKVYKFLLKRIGYIVSVASAELRDWLSAPANKDPHVQNELDSIREEISKLHLAN